MAPSYGREAHPVIMIDLNVLLDVLQKREPHYRASARLLELAVTKEVAAGVRPTPSLPSTISWADFGIMGRQMRPWTGCCVTWT